MCVRSLLRPPQRKVDLRSEVEQSTGWGSSLERELAESRFAASPSPCCDGLTIRPTTPVIRSLCRCGSRLHAAPRVKAHSLVKFENGSWARKLSDGLATLRSGWRQIYHLVFDNEIIER